MHLTISLAQIDIALGDTVTNLAKATEWIAEAAQRKSNLIIFPELWSTGYDLLQAEHLASQMEHGFIPQLANLAAQHQIWLSGSTLVFNKDGKPANRAILFDEKGEIVAWYDKIHLFGLMQEDQYLAPGEKLTLAQTPWGDVGLSICYDLRFPELFRYYALAGAKMIFLPSEWPHPRLAHWQTLMRARAIENQLYVLACNRVGQDRANTFCGHSAIIGPKGEIIAEAEEDETLLTATIDLAEVNATRAHMPVFKDRRPNLYQKTIS